MTNKVKSDKQSSASTRVTSPHAEGSRLKLRSGSLHLPSSSSFATSFSSRSSKEAEKLVKKVAKEEKYRQRKADIKQWEEKVEKKKKGIAEQKIWIEDWLRRRQNLENVVKSKCGGKCFSKMRRDLKKMKTEMEKTREEILKGTADILQWQKEIEVEKREIEKEMEGIE